MRNITIKWIAQISFWTVISVWFLQISGVLKWVLIWQIILTRVIFDHLLALLQKQISWIFIFTAFLMISCQQARAAAFEGLTGGILSEVILRGEPKNDTVTFTIQTQSTTPGVMLK